MAFDGVLRDLAEVRELVDRYRVLVQAPNLTHDLITTYPGFAWIKQYNPTLRTYTMLVLSEPYVRDLLGPRVLDYVGKTDFDFWPTDIAAVFYQNDDQARIKAGEGIWIEERFQSPLTGKEAIFLGCKWSFLHKGVTYVAGAGRGILSDKPLNQK